MGESFTTGNLNGPMRWRGTILFSDPSLVGFQLESMNCIYNLSLFEYELGTNNS